MDNQMSKLSISTPGLLSDRDAAAPQSHHRQYNQHQQQQQQLATSPRQSTTAGRIRQGARTGGMNLSSRDAPELDETVDLQLHDASRTPRASPRTEQAPAVYASPRSYQQQQQQQHGHLAALSPRGQGQGGGGGGAASYSKRQSSHLQPTQMVTEEDFSLKQRSHAADDKKAFTSPRSQQDRTEKLLQKYKADIHDVPLSKSHDGVIKVGGASVSSSAPRRLPPIGGGRQQRRHQQGDDEEEEEEEEGEEGDRSNSLPPVSVRAKSRTRTT